MARAAPEDRERLLPERIDHRVDLGVRDLLDAAQHDRGPLVGGEVDADAGFVDPLGGCFLGVDDEAVERWDATVAGLEGRTVGSVDRAVVDVLEHHLGRGDAGTAGCSEHLLEVQRLPGIDDVQHRVDAEVVLAATPIDLGRLLELEKPVTRVRYELAQEDGRALRDIVAEALADD